MRRVTRLGSQCGARPSVRLGSGHGT
uniref:Uncharacterized protein n=1 Tax=Arundo donax TaxID=35708 RepID=A0A0A9AMY8_ARUDO